MSVQKRGDSQHALLLSAGCSNRCNSAFNSLHFKVKWLATPTGHAPPSSRVTFKAAEPADRIIVDAAQKNV